MYTRHLVLISDSQTSLECRVDPIDTFDRLIDAIKDLDLFICVPRFE